MAHKEKTLKTNVARLMDKAGVDYTLIPYEFDENDLGAEHVAEALGEDIRQVFKTIVMRGERTGLLVCVVPGNAEVDLKKAARAAGDKKVEPLPLRELLPTTGYIRGGCSPIGMKKLLPTFIHRSAAGFEHIYVSAGQRGLQIRLAPGDLQRECRGQWADLVDGENEEN